MILFSGREEAQMAKGRFYSSVENFDWKGFQEHMGYSDAELEALKADEKKVRYVTTGSTKEWNDMWVVAEVVSSHGCESGMEVGDRLFFSGTGSVMEAKYCSNWCVHLLATLFTYVRGFRNLYAHGKDPTNMYVLYGGCPDNTQFGLGRVMFQLYFVPEKDVHNPKLHRPQKQGMPYYIED